MPEVDAQFATSAECTSILATIIDRPRVLARSSSIYPASRRALEPSVASSMHRRASKVTGLPLEDITERCCLVAYKAGEVWTGQHTALDLDTLHGRGVCTTLNKSKQRYAEAQLFLTAPPDGGGSLTFGDVHVPAVVGTLVWWIAAGANEERLPEGFFDVAPVTGDPCWVLQFRWRRHVPLVPLNEAERAEFVRAFFASFTGEYQGPIR